VLQAVEDGNRWQMYLEQNHFEYEAGGVLSEWLAAIYDINPRPISKSTGRKYGTQMKRFKEYCEKPGVCSLPALPVFVAGYLHDRLLDGATYYDIRCANAAIAYAHSRIGCADPTSDLLVKAVVRASKQGPASKQETH
jgi:hypothetical protein